MSKGIIERLDALRLKMEQQGVDAVIIPQTDPHQSEYIADHCQVRRFLSGFTGSAGDLVVTATEALLWTDSRYFIQAAMQLEGTPIKLMKDGLPDTPSIVDYLNDSLEPGSTVGIDGMLFAKSKAESMAKEFEAHGIKLKTDFDVIDEIWSDRPALPKDPLIVHDEKYTGLSAKDKIKNALDEASKQGADAVFICPLDEIAWTLNIRSRDVKYNPVAMSYLYLAPEGATLLVDKDKVTPEVKAYLSSQGVKVADYVDIKNFISTLPLDSKVLVEEERTSTTLCSLLGGKLVKGASVIAMPKSCKNDVQIAGFKAAMVRDGVALVKAFMEVERMLQQGQRLTEMGVDELLRKYRSQQDLFFDESFGSIVGYGPHGAIVHYEATPETDVELQPHGLLLVDSGAQYIDGTTDITRTISLGDPTPLEKEDFTLVLKGTIALSEAVFPEGTRGVQLDVLARQFLWKHGLSYLHGTGHGVGHFLNVHEGPQGIRMNYLPAPLMAGMVTSDEPGLYREGVHGIRCENLVLTVPAMTTEFGSFLKFETLTLYPFDIELMDMDLLTVDEIDWINAYHAEVYSRLSPYLAPDEQEWLASKTRKISK